MVKCTEKIYLGTRVVYKSKGTFKENKKHGLFVVWSEKGNKIQEQHWENGDLEGTFIEYYESGQKRSETNYSKGLKHGVKTTWYMGAKTN